MQFCEIVKAKLLCIGITVVVHRFTCAHLRAESMDDRADLLRSPPVAATRAYMSCCLVMPPYPPLPDAQVRSSIVRIGRLLGAEVEQVGAGCFLLLLISGSLAMKVLAMPADTCSCLCYYHHCCCDWHDSQCRHSAHQVSVHCFVCCASCAHEFKHCSCLLFHQVLTSDCPDLLPLTFFWSGLFVCLLSRTWPTPAGHPIPAPALSSSQQTPLGALQVIGVAQCDK